MKLVHDAAGTAFDPWLLLLFSLGGLLLTLWLWKSAGRGAWKWAAIFTLLLALLTVALPFADHARVQARAKAGDIVTAEGPVSGHKRWSERRWAGSSRGVGVTSFDRYDTTTYEYFYVGETPFTFIVNGYPSQASFTNSADPPVAIRDGMWAKAAYFADDWYDSERRITRLELGPPRGGGPAMLHPAAAPDLGGLPDDFAAFRRAFGDAIAREDQASVKALIAFPFAFEGHRLEADEFDSLWMSLFSPPQRPCLTTAKPIREGDRFVLFCGPYGYYFGKTAAGWRLIEFGADGEAM